VIVHLYCYSPNPRFAEHGIGQLVNASQLQPILLAAITKYAPPLLEINFIALLPSLIQLLDEPASLLIELKRTPHVA
jgi:hypothetical protein